MVLVSEGTCAETIVQGGGFIVRVNADVAKIRVEPGLHVAANFRGEGFPAGGLVADRGLHIATDGAWRGAVCREPPEFLLLLGRLLKLVVFGFLNLFLGSIGLEDLLLFLLLHLLVRRRSFLNLFVASAFLQNFLLRLGSLLDLVFLLLLQLLIRSYRQLVVFGRHRRHRPADNAIGGLIGLLLELVAGVVHRHLHLNAGWRKKTCA